MVKEKNKTILLIKDSKNSGKKLKKGFCYGLPESDCKRLVSDGDATFNLHQESAKIPKKTRKKVN